ncbi:MAG: hypothetical protein AB9919_03270 [Geobacteraceae bacterium]
MFPRTERLPSTAEMNPVSRSCPPAVSAKAAMGTWQPPSQRSRKARSAPTAWCVSGSFQEGNQLHEFLIVKAALNSQRPLTDGRQ